MQNSNEPATDANSSSDNAATTYHPIAPITGTAPITVPTQPQAVQPTKSATQGVMFVLLLIGSGVVGLIVVVGAGIVLFALRSDSELKKLSAPTEPSNNIVVGDKEKRMSGEGYGFVVPSRFKSSASTPMGRELERYSLEDSQLAMKVDVTVEGNPEYSPVLAEDAVISKIDSLKDEPNFGYIRSGEVEVLRSSHAYNAEIVYGEIPSISMLKSVLRKDKTTTVTLHISYPETMDEEARPIAQKILESLQLN